jgi:hypothetical protein
VTESNTKPQSILLRIEMVRARMHGWGLSSGDAGYIDPADPATLDHSDSRYVAEPASERLFRDLRRRSLGWSAAVGAQPLRFGRTASRDTTHDTNWRLLDVRKASDEGDGVTLTPQDA